MNINFEFINHLEITFIILALTIFIIWIFSLISIIIIHNKIYNIEKYLHLVENDTNNINTNLLKLINILEDKK